MTASSPFLRCCPCFAVPRWTKKVRPHFSLAQWRGLGASTMMFRSSTASALASDPCPRLLPSGGVPLEHRLATVSIESAEDVLPRDRLHFVGVLVEWSKALLVEVVHHAVPVAVVGPVGGIPATPARPRPRGRRQGPRPRSGAGPRIPSAACTGRTMRVSQVPPSAIAFGSVSLVGRPQVSANATQRPRRAHQGRPSLSMTTRRAWERFELVVADVIGSQGPAVECIRLHHFGNVETAFDRRGNLGWK